LLGVIIKKAGATTPQPKLTQQKEKNEKEPEIGAFMHSIATLKIYHNTEMALDKLAIIAIMGEK